MSLIEAAYDREVDVQNIIRASLEDIGRKQPLLLLSSCNFYLATHVKVTKHIALKYSFENFLSNSCFVSLASPGTQDPLIESYGKCY